MRETMRLKLLLDQEIAELERQLERIEDRLWREIERIHLDARAQPSFDDQERLPRMVREIRRRWEREAETLQCVLHRLRTTRIDPRGFYVTDFEEKRGPVRE